MVALDPIKTLKKRQADLKKQQELLLDLLKTKHKDFYKWMKDNNVEPLDLKAYSAGLAAAAVIALSVETAPVNPNLSLEPTIQVIELDELIGKNESQKAKMVWEHYGHVIKRNASKYNLDPKLIYATIMLESGGNTYAIRHEPHIGDSSYGLGQILYGTARGIGFEGNPQDLYDPEVNIELIARYHARNKTVYGDELTNEQLTAVYNTGNPYTQPLPGHLDKFNRWMNQIEDFTG
jgi:soluble lytic murein transglycosylase-like protein